MPRIIVICVAIAGVVGVVGCGNSSQHHPAAFTSGASSAVAGRAPDGRCLPARVTIPTATSAPGTPIVVSSVGGCADHSLAGAHYVLNMGFEGRQPPYLGIASVDPAADGAFSVELEVPANASEGDANVSITGSPFDRCDDTSSCAGYGALFHVGAPPRIGATHDVLGPGSWSGARTSSDGNQVLISLVGGARYDPTDSCTVAYSAQVSETDAEVHVRIGGTSPPSSGDVACSAVGYGRVVVLLLGAPFGTRMLVDDQFGRSEPVFDGRALAEPSHLPDSWQLLGEVPGYPNPETATYWSRTWGEPSPPPTDGRCTPSASPIMLTQGPADLLDTYPSNGEVVAGTDEVHGQSATFLSAGSSGIARLQWIEHGQAFVLATMPRCAGDAPASRDALVAFAQALHVP